MPITILYDLIYVAPIYFSLIFYIADKIGIEQWSIGKVCFMILCLLYMVCIVNIKNKYRILSVPLILVAMTGIIMVQPKENRYAYILDHRWIVWIILWIAMSMIIGSLVRKNKWLERTMAVFIVAILAIAMLNQINIGKNIIAFLFFNLLLFVAEETQRSWKKTGVDDVKVYMVSVAPFLMIICALVYVSPYREEPYDWKAFKNVLEKTVDTAKKISQMLAIKEDEYAQIGFSENIGFYEIENAETKDIIKIDEAGNAGNVIYLASKSFDYFDGREWKSTSKGRGYDHIIDTIETKCAVKGYDANGFNNYLKATHISLEYQEFDTRYVFAPQKTELPVGKIGDISYTDHRDSLKSGRSIKYKSKYKITYYRVNKKDERFADFINCAGVIDDSQWNDFLNKYDYGDTKGFEYADYIDYQDDIQKTYADEIIISDKLSKELEHVCSGATTSWDKMLCIERWLNSFEYTTKEGALPKEIDSPSKYLDYVLLERKAGMCNHFATAFALLARAEGLPSRVTQGCYIYLGNKSSAMVSNKSAHLWPEVYFDNVGWIQFEPTPGYNMEKSWNDNSAQIEIKDQSEYYNQEESQTKDDIVTRTDEEEQSDVSIKAVVIVIVVSTLSFVIILLLGVFINKKRNDRLDITTKACLMCKKNIYILKKLGVDVSGNKTLEEIKNTAKEGGIIQGEALGFIECYESMLYNNYSADLDMLKIVMESKKELLLLLREKAGVKYIIYYLGVEYYN